MIIEATTLATLVAFSTTGWLPSGFRWANGSLPVGHCISANGVNTNMTAAEQRTQISNAINAWRNSNNGGGLSCTTYDAVAVGGCTATVNSNNGVNDIFFKRNWTNGSGTIGVTWSSYFNNCGNVTDDLGQSHQLDCGFNADIELNDADYFWDDDCTDTDLASITAHEYGHYIGLDHCNENGTCNIGTAIMYAAYPGGCIRVPFNDDVQGACALYPGNPGGVGWPCANNNQCNSNICVNAGANGYCSQACGACPQGFRCEGMQCVRDDGLNRGVCELCQGGFPDACRDNGECFTGLPENNAGRCVMPCPNPGAANGGCELFGMTPQGNPQYDCYQVNLGSGQTGNYCFPISSNCTDLNNFTTIGFGQVCNGNPPCGAGLECIGICSQNCTTPGGPSNCPNGYYCEAFRFQDGTTQNFCAPPVNEGGNCGGVSACTVGPCLVSAQNVATCYRDCAGNPGACNNAQRCNTYSLQGGGSVSICEPPGAPPRPDAGVLPDSGEPPMCLCDVSTNCDTNCGCDQDCIGNPDSGVPGDTDGGMVDPGQDASTPGGNDAGPTPGQCTCDLTFSCDDNCESCDPECQCSCDETFACDEGCEACDPECGAKKSDGCKGCTSTEGRTTGTATALSLIAFAGCILGLLGRRRLSR